MKPRTSGALMALGPTVAIIGSMAVPVIYMFFHSDTEPATESTRQMLLGVMFLISFIGTSIFALGVTKRAEYQMKHNPGKIDRLLASPPFKIF